MSASSLLLATAQIYVWCYPRDERRDYAGWHLTADSAGCQLLASELNILANGMATRSRIITVRVATAELLAVPNNRNQRALAAHTLCFARAPSAEAFAIENEGGALTVLVGSARCDELREHILGISRGKGDVSMRGSQASESGRQRLWFWWMPTAPRQSKRRR